MNPRVKTILVPFVIVDVLFLGVLAFWLIHQHRGKVSSTADFSVELRHPESKLTEIDLVNNGNIAGATSVSVEVSWPDADLVEAKGLQEYSEIDTSRRSIRFYPQASALGIMISPGQPSAIGWVKLTDDVPVRAEIVTAKEGQP